MCIVREMTAAVEILGGKLKRLDHVLGGAYWYMER